MLQDVDLAASLPKAEYKARLPPLQLRLHQLQRICWGEGLASVVVFEGWETSGRGDAINKLTERLEPRGFELHTVREPRSYELQLPWMWRFWDRLPRYGQMALFDYSWYRRLFVGRVEGRPTAPGWERRCQDAVDFERALTDDRYVMVKLFLHISKKEKKRRLKALAKSSLESWRLAPDAWESQKHYDDYLVAIDDILRRTHAPRQPWTVIAASDRYWVRVRVLETLVAALEQGLVTRGLPLPEPPGSEELDEQEAD